MCVTDSGLFHLSRLTGLTSLNIHYLMDSSVTDRSTEAFSGLTNLVKLNLDSCSYSDTALEFLSRLVKLEDLSLEWCRCVEGSFVGRLTALTSLTTLSMCGSKDLREDNLQLFAALPAVQRLNMSYTNVVHESRAQLGNLPHIKLEARCLEDKLYR